MPLIESVSKKMIPDNDGGWYWMKWTNRDWEPVFVNKAGGGWHPTIEYNGHTVEVRHDNENMTWGAQIFPPKE